jgi:hypothetical protein
VAAPQAAVDAIMNRIEAEVAGTRIIASATETIIMQ